MEDTIRDALLRRKAQLLAQEQAVMGEQPAAPAAPVMAAPTMTQSQFAGAPRQPMSPVQLQQLARLLQNR